MGNQQTSNKVSFPEGHHSFIKYPSLIQALNVAIDTAKIHQIFDLRSTELWSTPLT